MQSDSASAIIKQKIDRIDSRRGYMALIVRILITALIVYLLFSQVFMITQMQGNTMFPALKDGDILIAFRLQREYLKNDIVIYTADGENQVGRLIAKGGDVVEITESGTLIINGTTQTGEIMYPTYPGDSLEYPYRVPEGHLFILGDYRTQTEDSRHIGPVPMDHVKAKVITLLRRRGL